MKFGNFAITLLAALFVYVAGHPIVPNTDLEFMAKRHSLLSLRGNKFGEFCPVAALQLQALHEIIDTRDSDNAH